jgi:hypothetical protein
LSVGLANNERQETPMPTNTVSESH